LNAERHIFSHRHSLPVDYCLPEDTGLSADCLPRSGRKTSVFRKTDPDPTRRTLSVLVRPSPHARARDAATHRPCMMRPWPPALHSVHPSSSSNLAVQPLNLHPDSPSPTAAQSHYSLLSSAESEVLASVHACTRYLHPGISCQHHVSTPHDQRHAVRHVRDCESNTPGRGVAPCELVMLSVEVPPPRKSAVSSQCVPQYFSNSLVTCAMVLPIVSGTLFHVNQPKKKVRPTKIR